MTPIRRTTLEILGLSQREHATELVIGLSDPGKAPIRFKVDGKWHDWKSADPDLIPEILAELGRLAAFSRGSFPKEGVIDLPYSGLRLLWRVRVASPEADYVLSPVEL